MNIIKMYLAQQSDLLKGMGVSHITYSFLHSKTVRCSAVMF